MPNPRGQNAFVSGIMLQDVYKSQAFISNVRLHADCRLIDEKKKIRIADLAYAVGFNDPKYFSSCFKTKFGLSPTEYMMKYDG